MKTMESPRGNIGLAVVCDGMGGLEEGEKASSTMVAAFDKWALERLPRIWDFPLSLDVIKSEWTALVHNTDSAIKEYGNAKGIRLGTTVVALLVMDSVYYVMNIGDSRLYEIARTTIRVTRDQTLVAREVELGNLTPEQAEVDPRRNIILQCVGASKNIVPDFLERTTPEKATFMLCSDGLYHNLTNDFIFNSFEPNSLQSEENMAENAAEAVNYVMRCGETDNISVVLVNISKETSHEDYFPVVDVNAITEQM